MSQRTPTETLHTRVPLDLLEKLDELARREANPLPSVVRRLLAAGVVREFALATDAAHTEQRDG